jgi:hypothetical protein
MTRCQDHSASGSITFSNLLGVRTGGSGFKWAKGDATKSKSPCHESSIVNSDTVQLVTDTR